MNGDSPHSAPSPSIPRHAKGRPPLIGITMGDPAGIGAEVVVKALADPAVRKLGRFIIYGLEELIGYAADQAEISPYWFRKPHEDIGAVESGVVVADYDEYGMFGPTVRRATAEGGHASMRFVDDAIATLRQGQLDAIVTGPINKTSWQMAAHRVPGHTERFAEAFGVKRYTMMFVADRLRVALASAHIGLFQLRSAFNIGCVFQPIDLLDDALKRWFGVETPRIAVAALNPHAGEGGLFGDEEIRIIEPAITMAREAGIDVAGPFPADTLFHRALGGEFDGVVAMYHDQALIPVKLLAFNHAVNVTLGLPAIRTSVDHGTAFDIAGKNQAHPGSMGAAIRLACELAGIALTAPALPGAPSDHTAT